MRRYRGSARRDAAISAIDPDGLGLAVHDIGADIGHGLVRTVERRYLAILLEPRALLRIGQSDARRFGVQPGLWQVDIETNSVSWYDDIV